MNVESRAGGSSGAGGDGRASVDDVYSRTRADLVRLAHLLTGSLEMAEDVVHDAFVASSRRWESIDSPEAYLRRAVVNAASMPVPVATYPGGTVFLLLTHPEAATVSVEGVTPAVEPDVSTTEVDDGGAGGDQFRVALVAVPEGPATMQQRGPGGEELGSITIENHPTL